MRAMVINQYGPPEVLKLQDMPQPRPGPEDLLLEVHASGVNPVDFKICRGAFRKGRALPFIPGYDVSGVVCEMSSAVRGFKIGDAVYASPSIIRNGADAEYVCVDARTTAHNPASLDHVQSAALPLIALTVWEAMLLRAQIRNGETMLIHAGGGGVGHVAIQLAKLHGCRVLTTASRDASIELCQRLGADVVINYSEEDFVKRVERETEGRGCPIVFDAVGGQTFDRSLDCLAVDGRLITVVGTPSPDVTRKLFRKNATLYVEFVGAPTVYGLHPESQGEILRAVTKLVDEGRLQPHVSRVFALEQLAEAHRLQESGHVAGKIV